MSASRRADPHILSTAGHCARDQPAPTCYDSHNQGWNASLERLAEVLAL
jgi:hypothetical protein